LLNQRKNLEKLFIIKNDCLYLSASCYKNIAMKYVHFSPWIGKNYSNGIAGNKVMVLGESHYCANPSEAIPEITQEVIKCYLNPQAEFEGWMNTYTKFIRALSGKEISRETSTEWWNKILFYNYVQEPISGARVRPTAEQFRNSSDAFFEILETYQPDKVIAWGESLYEHLPNQGHNATPITAPDGTEINTWLYPINQRNVEVMGITHPSTSFAWDYWHEIIKKFLKR
jgi:hypothetical protein